MRLLRSKGFVLAALIAIFVPATTVGCFGRFALTRKIYRFNRDLSHDRWIRWFGFLVMNFVPIYAAGGLIDLVFANSIEFWGGSNPFAMTKPRTRHALGPNGEQIRISLVQPGTLDLHVITPDGAVQSLRVIREADSIVAYDASGGFIARIGDVEGTAAVLEPAP